ncbi:MAG: hypothetical protein JO033_00695 [Acidobacteriaceae bacterium]|nr:hypothetical protein [Deltaproteobacteria bacterium]MBV8807163.1 hypothetical protein [Acidobacteriaceae bacterium]
MRRWYFILVVILLAGGLAKSGAAQVTPAPSEQPSSGRVLGSVTHGNTTVVFEAANPTDLDSPALRTWDDFAEDHEEIARALAFKPSLIDDERYLEKHPDLNDFFQDHPEVRDAMEANPGNFAAIPPRPGE